MASGASTALTAAAVSPLHRPLPQRRAGELDRSSWLLGGSAAAASSHVTLQRGAVSPYSGKSSAPSAAGAGIGATVTGFAVAALVGRRRLSRRRQRRARVVRLVTEAPVDYYGLLGIPRFSSDRKVITKGHRRVCRLVHPDILGDKSQAIMRIVTEAYEVLKDPEKRSQYDEVLKLSGGTSRRSKCPAEEDLPEQAKGEDGQRIFVDQTKCLGCLKCVETASSTFEADKGEGSARVAMQWADSEENIEVAMGICPSLAISLVDTKDLPFLEDAMNEWLVKRRLGQMKGSEMAGPFETYQQYQLMRLAVMDFESEDGALEAAFQVDEMSEGALELNEQAATIIDAVAEADIPDEVKAEVWPELGISKETASSNGDAFAGGVGERAQLVKALFMALDTDADGWLKENELRRFADLSGFVGDDDDWMEEYRLICMSNMADATMGVPEMLLFKMVNNDDDGGCYMTNMEIQTMLEELDSIGDYPLADFNELKFRPVADQY